MKKTIFTSEKFDSTKCKPNAFEICKDVYHGMKYVNVARKHHVNRSIVYLCNVGLDEEYGIGAIQLAIYRVMNRLSSGKIGSKKIVKILRKAKEDLKGK